MKEEMNKHLKEWFGVIYKGKIQSSKLSGLINGMYDFESGAISISDNVKYYDKSEDKLSVYLHEGCHFARHKLGLEWRDGYKYFEAILEKYHLPTNYHVPGKTELKLVGSRMGYAMRCTKCGDYCGCVDKPGLIGLISNCCDKPIIIDKKWQKCDIYLNKYI